jgi:hypothetical protein
MLIESGNEALTFNRKNAYETIEMLSVKDGINRNLYTRLIITRNSQQQPMNHGPGFCYYDLLYVSNNDLESRLIKDVVIY